MADPQDDNQNEAIMDIINAGTQYSPNETDNPDFDDDSQYLNFDVGDEQENVVQKNAGEVYLLIIKHILYMKLNIVPFVYITESLCFYVHSPMDRHR